MTVVLSGSEVAKRITARLPDAVVEANDQAIVVESKSLFEVARYLKESPKFSFDFLNYIAAVDYYDYFEIVYQLTSTGYNHSLVIKTRCYDRENPALPSVVELWRGADFQEREAYDLMGIRFEGHPDLRRIALWEGFEGHPLRRDFL